MKNRRIIGALIGLVGAVGNNGKTDNTDKIIKEALLAEDSEEMIARIQEEKFIISPNCRTCATPCGNTSDYDMDKLELNSEEIKRIKLRILEQLLHIAGQRDDLPESVYKALCYIGYDLDLESYLEVLQELQEI